MAVVLHPFSGFAGQNAEQRLFSVLGAERVQTALCFGIRHQTNIVLKQSNGKGVSTSPVGSRLTFGHSRGMNQVTTKIQALQIRSCLLQHTADVCYKTLTWLSSIRML